jgi:acyl-CoA thioesterase-1
MVHGDDGIRHGFERLSVQRRDFIVAAAAAGLAGLGRAATPATIVVVGDSLSAEYGLRKGTGWVPLLDRKLRDEKIDARVVNASISGDTTSGGRSRLPALLQQHKPTHVILELGGNDALRGLPLAMTQENLAQMTQAAQKAGATVLLLGIQMPPNYGADYGARFTAMYEDVGKRFKAAVVPFFLRGVADVPDAEKLFQPDRIHPTEQAQAQLLANVWPELRKLLVASEPQAGAKAAGGRGTRP